MLELSLKKNKYISPIKLNKCLRTPLMHGDKIVDTRACAAIDNLIVEIQIWLFEKHPGYYHKLLEFVCLLFPLCICSLFNGPQ